MQLKLATCICAVTTLVASLQADIFFIGMGWVHHIHIQEYWQSDKRRCVIANHNREPATLTFHEFTRSGQGKQLGGPLKIEGDSVLDIDAAQLGGGSVVWLEGKGRLGTFIPSRESPPEEAKNGIATHYGTNGSGGSCIWCVQDKLVFSAPGPLEIQVLMNTPGVLKFRKKLLKPELPGNRITQLFITGAKSDTLSVQVTDDAIVVDGTKPLRERPLHLVTLVFAAPNVAKRAMVYVSGWYEGPGIGAGVTRGILIEPKRSRAAMTPEELARSWAALGSDDVPTAHRNVSLFIASPETSLAFLRERVRPAATVERRQLDAWIAALDDNRFEVRELATAQLERVAELARPAIEAALGKQPGLESHSRLEYLLKKLDGPPAVEQLQAMRAVEALKYMDTPESRTLLKTLAGGAEGARLTQEAKAALQPRK